MREFFRRLTHKVGKSPVQAQEEDRLALQRYADAQADLAKSVEETNEKIRRYEEDRDAIIAEDDRIFKARMEAERAERETRRAQRQKLLDELKKKGE